MRKNDGKKISALTLLAVLTGLFSATTFVLPVTVAHAATNTFRPCDVVAGVSRGNFLWLRPDVCPGIPSSLTSQGTLTATGGTGFTTGAAFDVSSCDSAGVVGGIPNPNIGVPCLYATYIDTGSVAVFDNTGAFLYYCAGSGSFGGSPESANVVPTPGGASPILVVGNAGLGNIQSAPLPCLSTSTVHNYGPATHVVGTDWVDTQADKCTVNYTSESHSVYTFNICTNAQGADVATGTLTGVAFANRFIAGTGDLVADEEHVSIVNGGVESSTCDGKSLGAGGLFSMDVNPGGGEFAVGSFSNGKIDYITTANCASGKTTPDATFDTGCGTYCLFGVAIFGEVTATTQHGVPEFSAPAMLVAATGLLAIVLFRKFAVPKYGKL